MDEYCGYPAGDCVVWAQRKASPPRALVAISEDGKWLVVHHMSKCHGFDVYRFVEDDNGYGYKDEHWVQDTGQSADAVLAMWLEGRE